MIAHECSLHHVPMEVIPAEPRSRCPGCGYLTHHLQFAHCPECGHRLLIEEPEPRWHCPECSPKRERQAEEFRR
jgi:DNA-directed RNA polymerase subunit RPC12/RpoP